MYDMTFLYIVSIAIDAFSNVALPNIFQFKANKVPAANSIIGIFVEDY